jgi:GNAT superfamily N-acetyltransferase
MNIRKATILDISALLVMLHTMHKETEVDVPKINSAKMINKINELLHHGLILVAETDNKLIGSIGGIPTTDWWSDEKYMADAWFYVYKNHRNSNCAKNLVEHFIKLVKEVNMKIRLGHIFSGDVDRKDNLFERLGFTKVGSVFVEK